MPYSPRFQIWNCTVSLMQGVCVRVRECNIRADTEIVSSVCIHAKSQRNGEEHTCTRPPPDEREESLASKMGERCQRRCRCYPGCAVCTRRTVTTEPRSTSCHPGGPRRKRTAVEVKRVQCIHARSRRNGEERAIRRARRKPGTQDGGYQYRCWGHLESLMQCAPGAPRTHPSHPGDSH
jgi:hypothetical protein